MVLATKSHRAHLDIHFIVFFFFVHLSFRSNSDLAVYYFFPGINLLDVIYIHVMATQISLRLACCLNSLQRLEAVRSHFRFYSLGSCVLGELKAWRTGIMSMRVRFIGLEREIALR